MEGKAGHRLVSSRSALALGALAFVLTVVALVLAASARQSAGELIQTMALVPTAAVGTLVAVRRPGNPLGWLLVGAVLFFALNRGAVAYSVLDYRHHHGTLPLGRVLSRSSRAGRPGWS